jgi:RNA polymerase sigma factor (sigma-70 family)
MRTRIRAGDSSAFAELFDAYARAVYNHAFRLTADWSTAEDVMAATFMEAWKLRDRVDPEGGSLRPWLLGIATNTARNQYRSNRRYRRAANAAAAAELPCPTTPRRSPTASTTGTGSPRPSPRSRPAQTGARGHHALPGGGPGLRGRGGGARHSRRDGRLPPLPRPQETALDRRGQLARASTRRSPKGVGSSGRRHRVQESSRETGRHPPRTTDKRRSRKCDPARTGRKPMNANTSRQHPAEWDQEAQLLSQTARDLPTGRHQFHKERLMAQITSRTAGPAGRAHGDDRHDGVRRGGRG